jgi:signal transduction histidine kinase
MLLLRQEILDAPWDGFDAYRRLVNSQALRLGLVVTLVVQVPFVVFEWLALRDQFLSVQVLRALWLAPAVALYPFLQQPSARLLRHIDGIIWAIYVASAAFIVHVAFLHLGYESPYIHLLVMMFVGVGAVTLWPLWFAALFAAGVYGAYWLPLVFGVGTIPDLTNFIGYQGFVVGTMGIIMVSQQLRLQMAKADFDRRCRLQEREAQTRSLVSRVAVMRQERLNWLENLANFLRHELRNQAVAIGTSLNLTKKTPLDRQAEKYMERADRSLSRMKRLVDSATEATSLEAALASEETSEVSLTSLVRERATVVRDAYPERRVQVDVEVGVSVEGNEDRLAQLFDKLLENAVEHTGPGGTIQVKLRRDRSTSSVVIANDGDPLPPGKEYLFDAFVSGGTGNSDGRNLGLGLFVARAVVEAHGGTIEARDREGGGACFEVQLPAQ